MHAEVVRGRHFADLDRRPRRVPLRNSLRQVLRDCTTTPELLGPGRLVVATRLLALRCELLDLLLEHLVPHSPSLTFSTAPASLVLHSSGAAPRSPQGPLVLRSSFSRLTTPGHLQRLHYSPRQVLRDCTTPELLRPGRLLCVTERANFFFAGRLLDLLIVGLRGQLLDLLLERVQRRSQLVALKEFRERVLRARRVSCN